MILDERLVHFPNYQPTPMHTVYKYPLQPLREQTISMPDSAKILIAQMQGTTITLWAEVFDDNRPEERTFEVFGTGWHIEPPDRNREYVATVQDPRGLVWHIYEWVK